MKKLLFLILLVSTLAIAKDTNTNNLSLNTLIGIKEMNISNVNVFLIQRGWELRNYSDSSIQWTIGTNSLLVYKNTLGYTSTLEDCTPLLTEIKNRATFIKKEDVNWYIFKYNQYFIQIFLSEGNIVSVCLTNY